VKTLPSAGSPQVAPFWRGRPRCRTFTQKESRPSRASPWGRWATCSPQEDLHKTRDGVPQARRGSTRWPMSPGAGSPRACRGRSATAARPPSGRSPGSCRFYRFLRKAGKVPEDGMFRLFNMGVDAEFQIPLGRALGGRLASATFITLLAAPIIYVPLSRIPGPGKGPCGGGRKAGEPKEALLALE
jgi:hypothetical protein